MNLLRRQFLSSFATIAFAPIAADFTWTQDPSPPQDAVDDSLLDAAATALQHHDKSLCDVLVTVIWAHRHNRVESLRATFSQWWKGEQA